MHTTSLKLIQFTEISFCTLHENLSRHRHHSSHPKQFEQMESLNYIIIYLVTKCHDFNYNIQVVCKELKRESKVKTILQQDDINIQSNFHKLQKVYMIRQQIVFLLGLVSPSAAVTSLKQLVDSSLYILRVVLDMPIQMVCGIWSILQSANEFAVRRR